MNKWAHKVLIVLILVLSIALSACNSEMNGPDASADPQDDLLTTAESANESAETTPAPTSPTDRHPLGAMQILPNHPDTSAFEPVESENWSRWPAVSALPNRLQIDMETLIGREKNQRALDGTVVILDPGHGGKDPGAIVTAEDGTEVFEKTLNLEIAQKIKTELEALGARVIMTRTNDNWISLYQRVVVGANASLEQWLTAGVVNEVELPWINPILDNMQVIYNLNEDTLESGGRGMFQGIGANEMVRQLFDAERETPNIIFISVHCNSSPETITESHGTKLYYCTNLSVFATNTPLMNPGEEIADVEPIDPSYSRYDDEARIALATSIHDQIITRLPSLSNENDPVLLTGNYAFIRETALDSVLLECGYMNNPQDLAILRDPQSQQLLAEGVAEAVYQFFCHRNSIIINPDLPNEPTSANPMDDHQPADLSPN